MYRRTLLLLVLISVAGSGCADVYQYRDRNGEILLTDHPVFGGGYRLQKHFRMPGTTPDSPPDTMAALHRRRERLETLIDTAARAHGVSPALVHAVVRAESAYRTDAVSKAGAIGLMQLMPATAKRFGVRDPYDPRQNIDGGTRYLSQLLRMFHNNLRLAVAAYHAGENAVIRYGRKVPPFADTRAYVKRVMRYYHEQPDGDQLASR